MSEGTGERDAGSRAQAWLEARPQPAPPELRQRMAEALSGVSAATVPGALAEGALACLQTTLAAPEAERATALDLLAADALLTYALEAAAEIGASALQELAQAYGAGTLAGLLSADDGAADTDDARGEAPEKGTPGGGLETGTSDGAEAP